MAAVLSRGGGDEDRQTDTRKKIRSEDDPSENRLLSLGVRGQRGVKVVTFDLRQAVLEQGVWES